LGKTGDGFLGIIGFVEFDETKIGVDFNLVVEIFVVLFGFSDGNFALVDFSENLESFNELIDSNLFFEVLGEQVGIILHAFIVLLSGLFVFKPVAINGLSVSENIFIRKSIQNLLGLFLSLKTSKSVR